MPTIQPTRRALGALSVLAAAGPPRPGAAQQQDAWPERPVRLVVPFGPGGAIDTLSRTVAGAFPAQANGQALVVENRGGAGGTIAGAYVAQQRPDGYTLMMADAGANAVGQELVRGLSYDPARAFTPIVHLVNLPLVLVVRKGLEAGDLAGLIALAKGRADGLTYASPGVGHPTHLADELFGRMAGIRLTPVHYRSGADVMRSLLQNETDFAIISVSTAGPFIRDEKVRAVAVASTGPVPSLPGVPTIASVLPGFEATTWHGIVGPAGMAPELVARINRVFNAIIVSPQVRESVERTQAGEVIGGTPEQFAAFIRAEMDRWIPVIRAGNIRAD